MFQPKCMDAAWLTCFLSFLAWSQSASADIQRLKFTGVHASARVEIWSDDLFLVEYVPEKLVNLSPIVVSPMIFKRDFSGPTTFSSTSSSFKTAKVDVQVDDHLCLQVERRNSPDFKLCPNDLHKPWKEITLSSELTSHVYGLGQYFAHPDQGMNWLGRSWDPQPDSFGNRMRSYFQGAVGDTMMPIVYGLGKGKSSFAMFVDSVYKQAWDFTSKPWRAGMWGNTIRWFYLGGDNLLELRQKYMELVGRPPMPPKRLMGMWVSEFGYQNWQEVDQTWQGVRNHGFPLEGLALDLQWFGGTFGDPDRSRMGSLSFDERNFPSPKQKIADLKRQKIELMPIEEPYISLTLPEHETLAQKQALVLDCKNCGPTFLNDNPWWGRGGMLDFTNLDGAAFWHSYRRQPLVQMGITSHWLDLGEPEQANHWAWYYGFPELGLHQQGDVNNLYNFRWSESLAQGYEGGSNQRPMILSRSGTSGVQRFGTALWSGDIGTNWPSLDGQITTQNHVSLSGMDYYGSDSGGFQRLNQPIDGGRERLYTYWFAQSALFDFPLRPHAWNLDKKQPTAPHIRGDLASNLEQVRLRYRLIPYYYSLAYNAYKIGEAIVSPLVYRYQDDENLRDVKKSKMIGPFLMGTAVSSPFAANADVYLPDDKFYDFRRGTSLNRPKQKITWPIYEGTRLELPLLAVQGAIIPMQKVDDKTLNVFNDRADGSRSQELFVRVFPGIRATEFSMYEDDGLTKDYLAKHQFAQTRISQISSEAGLTKINVDATTGSYAGQEATRDWTFEIANENRNVEWFQINGETLEVCSQNRVDLCYRKDVPIGFTSVHIPSVHIRQNVTIEVQFDAFKQSHGAVTFICKNATTEPGTSVYVTGSHPKLGSWNLAHAVRLEASVYPTWSTIVTAISFGMNIEWKCLKRLEIGASRAVWEPGPNNQISIENLAFGTVSEGDFSKVP